MSVRAVVTGMGAVCGFGRGVERLWAALLEGQRAVRAQPALAAAGLTVGAAALVEELPWSAPSRAVQLARWAAEEALADAGEVAPGERLAVACATTLGGIGSWLPLVRADDEARATGNGQTIDAAVAAPARWSYNGPAQAVAAAAGAEGPLVVPSVACASGNVALDCALRLVRSGRCDVVVAGGADALHDFVIQGFGCLKALDPEPCRPFDRRRRGLNLGEGAAFLVVEAEPHARARGARIRAFLDGSGIAADAVHMTGPDREGRGAARAMLAALGDAGRAPGDVGFVSAHGTATQFNDLMEAQALRIVLGARAGATPSNSIKSALGHTLGAAAVLEAIACVRTLETGRIPPTPGLEELDPAIALDVVQGAARTVPVEVALSTASGFGGTNAAVVLSRT